MTTQGESGFSEDFSRAVRELKQCISDPATRFSEVDELESALGRAALALMQSADPVAYRVRIGRLESDFGRAARALMQCSSDPGAESVLVNKLESDFARAALALRQCSSDPGTNNRILPNNLQSDFGKAAVAVLQSTSKTESGQDLRDFINAAKALAQCSSDPGRTSTRS